MTVDGCLWRKTIMIDRLLTTSFVKQKKNWLEIQFSILEIGEGESVRESVFSKMKMILKVQVSEVVKFVWTTLIKVSSSCHLSSFSSKKSFFKWLFSSFFSYFAFVNSIVWPCLIDLNYEI